METAMLTQLELLGFCFSMLAMVLVISALQDAT